MAWSLHTRSTQVFSGSDELRRIIAEIESEEEREDLSEYAEEHGEDEALRFLKMILGEED